MRTIDLFFLPILVEEHPFFTEQEKSFPGHAGIPGHVGGSAPRRSSTIGGGHSGSNVSSINLAQTKISDRAAKLGYTNVTFQPDKSGRLQVVAQGPRAKSPQKLNLYIDENGVIVNRAGKRQIGW